MLQTDAFMSPPWIRRHREERSTSFLSMQAKKKSWLLLNAEPFLVIQSVGLRTFLSNRIDSNALISALLWQTASVTKTKGRGFVHLDQSCYINYYWDTWFDKKILSCIKKTPISFQKACSPPNTHQEMKLGSSQNEAILSPMRKTKGIVLKPECQKTKSHHYWVRTPLLWARRASEISRWVPNLAEYVGFFSQWKPSFIF